MWLTEVARILFLLESIASESFASNHCRDHA